MQEDCIVLILMNENRSNNLKRKEYRNNASFRFTRQMLLSTLKLILKDCAETSPGYEIKIPISKTESFQKCRGVFSKNETRRILGTFTFHSIRSASQILGGLANRFCRLPEADKATLAITEYVDRVTFYSNVTRLLIGSLCQYSNSRRTFCV